MIQFSTSILRFEKQGEKTGWTYIAVTQKIAQQLKPGIKKSFRVKGRLDNHVIKAVALLPMGGGDFIMPFNAAMRKGTGKRRGDTVKVQLACDDKPLVLNKDLMACLEDEPAALKHFESLPRSFQQYFSKWIESARTEATKTKRIVMAVSALAKKMNFPEMIRSQKQDRDELSE